MDSLTLQKFVSDSPLPGVTAASRGLMWGLERMAGTREGKGHTRAWRRECYGANRGEFSGKGKGGQRRGYHGCHLISLELPRRLAVMLTQSLSYIQSPESIMYSYLSSGNNLQTLVGTRHWVLGTQVFLVILKQRKVW